MKTCRDKTHKTFRLFSYHENNRPNVKPEREESGDDFEKKKQNGAKKI